MTKAEFLRAAVLNAVADDYEDVGIIAEEVFRLAHAGQVDVTVPEILRALGRARRKALRFHHLPPG